MFFWSREAVKLSNQAIFWRLHLQSPGVIKICDSITSSWKSVFSCQLYENTMFIEMYGNHWLKTKLMLNKGFNNSLNKFEVEVLTVTQWDTHVVSSHHLLRGAKICFKFTICRQHCKQLCRGMEIPWYYLSLLECNFSRKAEMNGLKEILRGQTYNPKPCIHKLPKEMVP